MTSLTRPIFILPCAWLTFAPASALTSALLVADNGRGLPRDFSRDETKSLGLTLARMLGEHQLGGTYTVVASRDAAFTLSGPIDSWGTA